MARSTAPELPTPLDTGVPSLMAWTWGGDASLPLVIGVHDLAGNGLWWADLAVACAGRLRFAALDLRGRGGSWTLGATASLVRHVGDVRAVVDALAAKHVVIAGHGTGAAVAMQAAAESSTRAAGVMLLDGPPALSEDDIAVAVELDPGVALAGTTYAHRDEHLRAVLDAGWLPATGLTRNARRAVTADLAGSGFAWRVQLDRRAIDRDLTDLSRWVAPPAASLPSTLALQAAHGHRLDDPPLLLLAQPDGARTVPSTHAGLLLNPTAVSLVADALVERFAAG